MRSNAIESQRNVNEVTESDVLSNSERSDALILAILFVGAIVYLIKYIPWGSASNSTNVPNGDLGNKVAAGKDIVAEMDEAGKNCVIFFGSQTGTAENFAVRLAKEGASRFGLKTMVADLDEYTYESLDVLTGDKVAFFVLATHGDGEPTDNAIRFHEFLTDEGTEFSKGQSLDDRPLENLRYVAFGLGNKTYEQYNAMIRKVNTALERLGAAQIGVTGEGDDAGSIEEDFMTWKEPMWAALSRAMTLKEREVAFEPSFNIVERDGLQSGSATVFLGEPTISHLEGRQRGPYTAHNPFIASIAESRELFNSTDRNCVHLEVDIQNSDLTYTAGDHIAVWPTNSNMEVDRFLKTFGLSSKPHCVISVESVDSTLKAPFPTPTTYDAMARYYLEICGPVSRQLLIQLAAFAPTDSAKAEMTRLGTQREYFQEKISKRCLNLAQTCGMVAGSQPWSPKVIPLLIESLNRMLPRYYSISSSPATQKDRISITAIVESKDLVGNPDVLKGVSTNYLLALCQKQGGEPDPDPNNQSYTLDGPRQKYSRLQVPVHVRQSNFRLPSDPATPIIMVGPGTGVAPFRGFVQERAAQARAGVKVGKTLLFTGSRKRTEDFLYPNDWEVGLSFLGHSRC